MRPQATTVCSPTMTEIRRKVAFYSHLAPPRPAQSLLSRSYASLTGEFSVTPSTRVATLVLALATVGLPTAARAQFRYPPMYPYPAYRYGFAEADLRVKVKPKDASVYVDGYYAGKVEDYDGAFERLHVEPGQHEIIVYLDGYRSLHQRLYLSPNSTRKIEGTLERLAAQRPGRTDSAARRPTGSTRPRRRPTANRRPGRRPASASTASDRPRPATAAAIQSLPFRHDFGAGPAGWRDRIG